MARETVEEKHRRLEGTGHCTWVGTRVCEVLGDTGLYLVTKDPNFECGYSCGCKWFIWRETACSHIYAAKLARVTGGGILEMQKAQDEWRSAQEDLFTLY